MMSAGVQYAGHAAKSGSTRSTMDSGRSGPLSASEQIFWTRSSNRIPNDVLSSRLREPYLGLSPTSPVQLSVS
jgi:hypothetical protein